MPRRYPMGNSAGACLETYAQDVTKTGWQPSITCIPNTNRFNALPVNKDASRPSKTVDQFSFQFSVTPIPERPNSHRSSGNLVFEKGSPTAVLPLRLQINGASILNFFPYRTNQAVKSLHNSHSPSNNGTSMANNPVNQFFDANITSKKSFTSHSVGLIKRPRDGVVDTFGQRTL